MVTQPLHFSDSAATELPASVALSLLEVECPSIRQLLPAWDRPVGQWLRGASASLSALAGLLALGVGYTVAAVLIF